jgi:hypothetical protein
MEVDNRGEMEPGSEGGCEDSRLGRTDSENSGGSGVGQYASSRGTNEVVRALAIRSGLRAYPGEASPVSLIKGGKRSAHRRPLIGGRGHEKSGCDWPESYFGA